LIKIPGAFRTLAETRSAKNAWRMFHNIRSLLDQGDPLLGGTVEADEAYVGRQAKWRNIRDWQRARGAVL
jgi:hypothetical protein